MGKLLEQLRDRREALETEIKAPVIKALNNEKREKEVAIKKYQEIEFKLGQDIIKLAMERAKEEIARNIYEQFAKYMHDAGAYNDEEDFTFKINKRYARIAYPDNLVKEALNNYVAWSRPKLKISNNPFDHLQTIQINIPSLNINVKLDN